MNVISTTMRLIILFALTIIEPITLLSQTYTTTSQGRNYNNGGAYVAPVVTKTYTVKPLPYTAPLRTPTNNSGSVSSKGFTSGGGKSNNSSSSSYLTAPTATAPNTAEDYHYLGISKYSLDQYEASIAYYYKAIELDPNHSESYVGIGMSKYKQKDYAGSIQAFTKAIEITPTYQYAYMNRGDSKRMLNDLKGAIEDYDKSITLEAYASTYYSRGLSKYGLQLFKGAGDDFTKTIELCDETQKLWDAEKQKEFSSLSNKSKKAALQKSGREIDREPIYAGSFYLRGSVKMQLKDLTGALEDFNRAIAIDPMLTDAYYTRALVHLVNGNKTEGCADLKKALELGYATAADLINKYCL